MRGKQPSEERAIANSDKASFLARSDLFRHLTMAEITTLEHTVNIITCAAGRILYRPGETGSSLFLLKSGRVQLYHLSTDGRKLITATLAAGACFGEIPLIGQCPQNSFAEILESASLCVISKNDIDQLLDRYPAIARSLLSIVGQHFVQLENQLINATFKDSQARVATLLLQLVQATQKHEHHDHTGDAITISGFSHEELAERLGVYRETVTIALRELKDAGAIELGRKHITIRNLTILEQLAA
ncbi:MAG TPA: Crp/Fnr family transcriptional regulator [Ktedonobacteraceae bacterium]|nr:Crp/Fnr family transcriptional regulator [Ktedonobacteraceae bacterium]